MLSSSVVTVLAPHRNGRLKRTKRPEVTGNSEAQGSLQDVTNTAANRAHERFQETGDSSLTDGSQAQPRVPFLGTRRNTVGWSTKSGPASFDYESKRKMIQTASLDVNFERMNNKNVYQNEQRRNPHTDHQGGLSSLSSKPTTSSMLLSLRRLNSNGMNTNTGSPIPEKHSLPLSGLPRDQDGKLFTTHLSQTFLNNNNEQERSKALLSPSSISYRKTDTGLIFPPSSSSQRERNTFETCFSSASPTSEDAPFSQQAQSRNRTDSSLSCFKHAFPIGGLTERRENCMGSDKSANVFPERSASSPRHSLLKTYSLPRRTTLTSTSFWKNVTQEGSFPLTLNDATNIKEKSTAPLVPPCNKNRDLFPPSPTDINRLSQIPKNTDNNSTTESVRKDNMNLMMKRQGGTDNLKQRIAEDSPDHKSDRLVKQQYGSNLNNREPQKPQSLPGVLSCSKISRATEQTMLSHPLKDLSRHDVNTSSFTANVTELPPTWLNPKSSNTPTESSSKYNNEHCTSNTNSTPTSSRNADSQKFTKPSLPLANTNTLSSQALTSKTVSGLPLSTNIKTTSSVHSYPVASRTNICAPTYTGSSSQTPKFTAHATPLGFERSFASVHKPFHAETISAQNSPESDPKKPQCVEGKRVRRVTWEDSVDLNHSEPATVEKAELFQVPTTSSSPQGGKVPSIFSFHRSSSPTTNSSHLCSPSLKTSGIQVGKGGKYRSMSSDSADLASREQRLSDTMIFDQRRRDLNTPRPERTHSAESGILEGRSSAPLSLPPDFSSGYKLRYSSPPYSTLMSTRSTQGETKTILPRSPLFQQSQSKYKPHLSICTDSVAAMTSPTSKPPLLPINLSLPFQIKTTTKGNVKRGVSETDQVNNNPIKSNSQDCQDGPILLVDNRLDEAHNSFSTCVTETLVYSIKPKVDTAPAASRKTTPKPLQHTTNTQAPVETKLSQSHRIKSKDAAGEPHRHSDQSSSGSSSSSSGRTKENVLGLSRFFSVESNTEQSPKKSLFALKKTVATPQSSLSRSQSERASKTNNKMDQVLNKLRQTFSTRRSDDDVLFPWKWKRASQTPSLSGSSDVSDITVESPQKVEQQEQKKGMQLKDDEKGVEGTNRWTTNNRYTLIPPSAARSTMAEDELYIWSDESTQQTDQDEQTACAERMESQIQPHFTITSPTTHQLDFYKDNGTNDKPTNQFLYCREPSPGTSPNPSPEYPTQFRKSTSSPRSPFSPFSSLSPVSQFTSMDVTDDSVFYSPKLQRQRESLSPGEPGEGMRLGGSRRSRASTGPPSPSPGRDTERLASSYADLKYGIEPGRSFSVSSVLSSRPSGPGRISTGSRFMSVGDLTDSALACRDTRKDLDQWSITPDWTTEYDRQHSKDHRLSFFPSDPGKMRSRSLPRSLTRRLANSSSKVFASPPVTTTTSKSARLWSPTCHFAWDTEGPPTPPPTPPLSPVSRRMSKPPSLSSPTFPSSPGASQQVDNLSPRGLLPSRGYVSSLSTFEESSDSSSDTTTDDEYYLETDEDKEKETEL
ncbi:serine-rich adhesin for platelets [Clinocottus analis]|uniref:serine-rich adhesin for platelets n=1 Tax=Clinocottus analis TaxID=304258 RepID=UPI0035C0C1A2